MDGSAVLTAADWWNSISDAIISRKFCIFFGMAIANTYVDVLAVLSSAMSAGENGKHAIAHSGMRTACSPEHSRSPHEKQLMGDQHKLERMLRCKT
jgi:hypothetical protein